MYRSQKIKVYDLLSIKLNLTRSLNMLLNNLVCKLTLLLHYVKRSAQPYGERFLSIHII